MPQREPALLWLRDFALTALVLALCTLTSWVFSGWILFLPTIS